MFDTSVCVEDCMHPAVSLSIKCCNIDSLTFNNTLSETRDYIDKTIS